MTTTTQADIAQTPVDTPTVRFHQLDGHHVDIVVEPGQSVMTAALAHGVSGIIGECGGEVMCATCHVYVREGGERLLSPMSEDEQEMLDETACVRRENSRLGCQLRPTAGLLEVDLPERQV